MGIFFVNENSQVFVVPLVYLNMLFFSKETIKFEASHCVG